jgi:hypothetical protein
MTALTSDYLRTLAVAPNRLGDGWRISAVAALHQSADALAAERDRADRAEALLEEVTSQRDELASQLGIEPEWTEADA